ncbi:hypothetical protein IH982_01295 [Patescibacteria group bacterium]|nr:hypothetical protein [Patescibacteria group bacterium]
MKSIKNKKLLVVAGLILSLGVFVAVASANNSWSKYHWNISTAESIENPLVLGNNLTTSAWNTSLAGTSADWNASVLKNGVVAGTNTDCNPVLGGVEVCNSKYGNNGWLGIAQIWIYRGRAGHIAQGLVKVNDTYFNTPQYDTQAWRNLVMCQEVGHTYGLGHQDEDFSNANLGTCMDYTSDPDGTILGQLDNQHPNQHDYDVLTKKYAHLNETTSDEPKKGKGGGNNGKKKAGVGANIDLSNPSAWGQAIKQDAQGRNSLYERNLVNGVKVFTFVIWADGE